MKNKYRTKISWYSLRANNFGKPSERTPIINEHKNPQEALCFLFDAIENNLKYKYKGEGEFFYIITPDNREISLNAAYKEVFNEEPINTNKGYKYPKIKR